MDSIQSTEAEILPVSSGFNLPPNTLLLVSAVVAVLGVLVFILLQRRTSAKGSTILLVGPSDGGKSAVFSSLVYSTNLPSHTSMQANSGSISIGSETKPTPVKIVDIPGHPRIRATFADHISDALAIVFVVDTSTIARNGAAVAEHLHLILHAISTLPPSQRVPPLLIHAHKSDLLVVRSNTPSSSVSTKSQTRSLARDRTRTILERELEKRRKAAATGVNVEGLGAVVGGGPAADAEAELGGGLECSSPDGSFKFDKWDGGEVEFSAGWVDVVRDDGITESGKPSEDGVDGLAELKEWLDTL